MKKILYLIICLFPATGIALSQSTGKPTAELFTDFHYVPDDTSATTGFGINRAYIGYNYMPEGDFSGSLIINVGSPSDMSTGSKHRRYSFFREASLSYTKNNLNVSFGITSTRATRFQQAFIGKRYIAESFQAILGYSVVADMGIVVDYKFNKYISADLAVMNGDGYLEPHFNNSLKQSLGLTICPTDNTVLRLYGDVYHPSGIWQNTFIGFAGIKDKHFALGLEGSYKWNLDLVNGHDAWGISATAAKSITEKTEVFARYDCTTSASVPGEDFRWFHAKDGIFWVLGLQHTFNPNVRMALDYQVTDPHDSDREYLNAVYFNAHFRF